MHAAFEKAFPTNTLGYILIPRCVYCAPESDVAPSTAKFHPL